MSLNKSFTLIEALIALFVLTTGVIGVFALIQRTVAFSSISNSQLVATYLAQEGIEIIRNIRDTNYLEGQTWDADISDWSSYQLDYQSSTFPDGACGDYLKHEGNFYVCSSDVNAKFQRKITVEKLDLNGDAETDMRVSVLVIWPERGRIHQVTAETELYDWR